MRRTVLFAALAIALIVASRVASAAEDAVARRAVVVLSIASYNDIRSRLDLLGKISRHAELAKSLETALDLKTHGQGLKGLDKTRPSGVLVTTDGHDIEIVGFVPVVDLKQLLQSIAPLAGLSEPVGADVIALSVGGQRIYFKQQGSWAFVGQSADSLAVDLPADPGKSLAGLDKQSLLAARIFVQSIPRHFRDMIVDQLRASIDDGPGRNETPGAEFRRRLTEQQVEAIIRGIHQVDQLTISWGLDPQSQSTTLDASMTVVSGGALSEGMTLLERSSTDFTGFLLPDAALVMNLSSEYARQHAADLAIRLQIARDRLDKAIDADDRFPDANEKHVAKEIVGQLVDTLKQTVESGKVDGALSITVHDKQWAVVGAAHSTDPQAIAAALGKFVELERHSRPNFPAMEKDIETIGDIHVHKLSIPLSSSRPAATVLGDHVDIVVGVGDKAVYFAGGAEALPTLKKSLMASKAGQKAAPLQLSLSVAQLAGLADATSYGPLVSLLATGLTAAPGKDHLILSARPIEHGVLYRLEVEQGVLGVATSLALGFLGVPASL